MPQIDLRRYVTAKAGAWLKNAQSIAPSLLLLSDPEDTVTLAGPLRVNVGVVAENVLLPAGDGETAAESGDLFSYDLEIPAGQTWTYRRTLFDTAGVLGTNAGWQIAIRPGRPKPQCPPVSPPCDPCDFAVADCPDTGSFFPAGCEPCKPGTPVSLPPGCSTSLAIPTASGGCIHPRYFNGMSITAEDLQTQLRYIQLKLQLHNRAAGHGVVWGLQTGLDGGKVRVCPGYAVDCCGHDLTVVTTYSVDVRSLLCDPASNRTLAATGAKRMHLLLEYVECLQDPRPVHGDPCSTGSDRCEMSRVRETVRLRLVPPRDPALAGPIGEFLKEIQGIRPAAAAPPKPASGVSTPAATAPNTAAFQAGVAALWPPDSSFQLRPDRTQPVQNQFNMQGWKPGQAVHTTITADASATFQAGAVTRSNGSIAVASATPPFTSLSWDVDPRDVAADGGRQFEFATWNIAASNGTVQLSGHTEILLQLLDATGKVIQGTNIDEGIQTSLLRATVTTTIDAQATLPGSWPCIGGQCATGKEPLFPVLPPWFVHPDPVKAPLAADPDVLLLAAIYALLAMVIARFQNNLSIQQLTPLALRVFAQRLFPQGNPLTASELNQVAEAVERLFAAWCCNLLYPGPRCAGELHGVVIGCAVVNGGTIQSIDPWGGRRYVVHYPLLEHWGLQFGITPLDIVMSKVGSFICCIAGLPVVRAQVPGLTNGLLPEGNEAAATPDFPVLVSAGGAYFVAGTGDAVPGVLAQAGLKLSDTRTIALFDFVNRMFQSIGAPVPAAGTPFIRYVLAGNPDISLLAPGGAAAVTGIVSTRLAGIVSAAQQTTLQPLLRPVAQDLTSSLLEAIPLSAVVPAGNPVVKPLDAAGVKTVAAVLSFDPEALHQQVLGGAEPAAMATVLKGSESAAASAARAVNDALKHMAKSGVASRAGLASAEQQRALSDALTEGLGHQKLAVPAQDVQEAVARVLGPSGAAGV